MARLYPPSQQTENELPPSTNIHDCICFPSRESCCLPRSLQLENLMHASGRGNRCYQLRRRLPKEPSPPSAVPATLTWLTGPVERSSPRHKSRERLDNSTKVIHEFIIPECHRGICQGMWQRLAHLQYIQSHSAWKKMKGQRGTEWRGDLSHSLAPLPLNTGRSTPCCLE